MTLRYDQFLTPFVSPALGRIDVSGLERAGQAMSDRAKYEQARQDRLDQEARNYELEKQQTEGRNRYYDAQAETHRMAQEQARNAATEKRASALFDAFRKAKTPVDRRAVMDELQRLGYSVEEQSTELPAEQGPQLPPTETAAVPSMSKPGKPGRTPKPNPKFAAALGQLVASENAQEAPVDESQLGKGTLASVLGIPGAGAVSGEASGASAAAEVPEPTAPMRGGRFVIKDKSGATVHQFDEPLERMKSQMAIKGALGAMGIAATNDRERNAVQAASVAGAQMLDLGLPPDQAVKYSIDVYGKTLKQEYKLTYPQGTGGAGGGGGLPSKTQLKIEGMDREQENRIIQRVAGNYDAKGMHQGIAMARRALSSLDSGSGIGDLDAFKSYLLQMSGKVVTDKEMDQFMHSEGAWVGWEKKFNEYAKEGRFPPEFTAPLRAMFQRFITLNSENLQQMGNNAREQARLSKLPPEQQAIVSGHFTGDFGGQQGSGGGADTRSDEDLVKAWKAGRK